MSDFWSQAVTPESAVIITIPFTFAIFTLGYYFGKLRTQRHLRRGVT